MRKRHGKARLMGIALVIGVLAAGTYAFTNSNTVGTSYAGQGQGNITGYVLSNIDYTESATNPHKVQSVEFDLDQPADVVKVSVINSADTVAGATTQTWYTCTAVGNRWTCPTGATDLLRPEMSAANELDVVAYQS